MCQAYGQDGDAMIDKIETGGPAFPIPIISQDQGSGSTTIWQTEGGMDLRDYFAARAMPWFMENVAAGEEWRSNAAKLAYSMADEMIKARKS